VSVPLIVPPGDYVYFNDRPAPPEAVGTIFASYLQWLGQADPHLRYDDQAAKRFLFAVLTQKLRKIISIPDNIQVIGVKALGFDSQKHRELWLKVGILEVERKRVELVAAGALPAPGEVMHPRFKEAVAARNKVDKAERRGR
jgi:hypothetical protein